MKDKLISEIVDVEFLKNFGEGDLCCGSDFCEWHDHTETLDDMKKFLRQALDKAYEAGKEHAYVMATEDINNLTNKDERGN